MARLGARKSRAVAHKKRFRSQTQAAIEYLMTYGWAVILVAIVLTALFQLHVFSFTQLAQPGSCQVVRPSGPYTTAYIDIEGICTNLNPLTIEDTAAFITKYFPNGGKGGGGASYPVFINVNLNASGGFNPFSNQFGGHPSFTLTGWIYYTGLTSTHCQGIISTNIEPGAGFAMYGYGGNNGACGPLWINGSYVKWPPGVNSFGVGRWIFVAAVYNGTSGNATVYVNATPFANATISSRTFLPINSITIGADVWNNGDIYPFNGSISNVQLYNRPLTQAEIRGMYLEGIGGDPIFLQNLVGWWPLNENTNDYSGNNNNGTPYNVTYVGSYATPPP